MKITYLKLENFAGIYAGTGKKVIEIDFKKKNKNPIVVLNGRNGSGKTVLLSCLNPFRETHDERKDIILEGEKGYKEIHFSHKKDKFVIKHFYGNSSTQNKSFIEKNGEELNENGGIRTFNQIVENELKVSNDYFKIGRLGNNVRNFIDLSTAERKKYINQFIPSIDEYLRAFEIAKNIYSDENKKLKSLKGKLERFDDFDLIKNEKNKLEELSNEIKLIIESLKSNKEKLIFNLNVLEAKVVEKMDKYDIKSDVNIKNNLNIIKDYYDKIRNKLITSEEYLNKVYEANESLKNFTSEEINIKVNIMKDRNNNYLNDLENKNKLKDDYKLKLINLKNKLTDYENKINSLASEDIEVYIERKRKDSELLETNMANYISISLNEEDGKFWDNNKDKDISFSTYVDSFKILIERFVNIKSKYNFDIIDKMSSSYIEYDFAKAHNYIYEEREKISIEESNINKEITSIRDIIKKIENNESIIKILDKRPDTCNDDNCPFISNAVIAKEESKKLDDYYNKFNALQDDLIVIKNKYDSISNFEDYVMDMESIITLFNTGFTGLSNIHNFEEEIFKNGLNFLNDVLNRIEKLNDKNNYKIEIDRLKESINKCDEKINQIKEYDKIYDVLKSEKQEVSESIIKLEKDIENINVEIEGIEYTIRKNNSRIKIFTLIVEGLKNVESYKDLVSEIYNVSKEIEEIYDNSLSINNEISEINNSIKMRQKEYDDFIIKLNKINKDYILVESTINEIKDIEANYDTYKIIKDSLDPKIGIPLIFMQSYLQDISMKANELLQISSKDNFQIRFEITESDFFIQIFKSDGTFLKDINEASQGETSLTNISLSLAMIEKMMDEYNILYLDEVDATLSTANRRLFLDLVEKQIKDLGIEQCFVISHNNEFYSSNVDLILLKDNDVDQSDKDLMNGKNIIFDINK